MQPRSFLRADGIVGVGFVIAFGGVDQFSIAWPDRPCERFTPDMAKLNLIEVGQPMTVEFHPIEMVEIQSEQAESVTSTESNPNEPTDPPLVPAIPQLDPSPAVPQAAVADTEVVAQLVDIVPGSENQPSVAPLNSPVTSELPPVLSADPGRTPSNDLSGV